MDNEDGESRNDLKVKKRVRGKGKGNNHETPSNANELDKHQLVMHKIFQRPVFKYVPPGQHPYEPQNTLSIKIRPDADYNNNKEERSDLSEVTPTDDTPVNTVHRFNASVQDIITAIITGDTIDGIRLIDEVQKPDFRFETSLDTEFGAALSQAFVAILVKARSMAGKKGAAKTNKIRSESANDYATNMHKLINDLKSETGISTYKATAELLTERGVETPNGGKWHISTIQDLEKRWKSLGLMPSKSSPE